MLINTYTKLSTVVTAPVSQQYNTVYQKSQIGLFYSVSIMGVDLGKTYSDITLISFQYECYSIPIKWPNV